MSDLLEPTSDQLNAIAAVICNSTDPGCEGADVAAAAVWPIIRDMVLTRAADMCNRPSGIRGDRTAAEVIAAERMRDECRSLIRGMKGNLGPNVGPEQK